MNCSSDLKDFVNSWPSAPNLNSFYRSLRRTFFFLTVGQNNFGNKIPFPEKVFYLFLFVTPSFPIFCIFVLQIMWPLLYPEWYKKLDVKRTKGVLIHGPPGCGKTTLVRAMASMAGATFLSISAASIFSPYVGDSEKSLTQVFHKARLGKEDYKSSFFLDFQFSQKP